MNEKVDIVSYVARMRGIYFVMFLFWDLLQIFVVSIISIQDTNQGILRYSLNIIVDAGQTILLIAIIGGAQIIMLYISLFRILEKKYAIQIYPVTSNIKINTKYSPNEIIKWTLDIAKESNVKIDRIVLMDDPSPNAFTVSLPFFGSLVSINSNILDISTPKEIKAVIAHEVGHLVHKDSMLSVLVGLPSFYLNLAFIYFYARLILGIGYAALVWIDPIVTITRTLLLVIVFLFVTAVSMIGKYLISKSKRYSELLADYHMGKIMGKEIAINALLRLGQRAETVITLLEELKWLDELKYKKFPGKHEANPEILRAMLRMYPASDINEENAKEMAPIIYVGTQLMILHDVYKVPLDEDTIRHLATEAAKELRKIRAEESKEEPSRAIGVVDWRKLDVNRDLWLEPPELEKLIQILKNSTAPKLFRSETRMSYDADHPDFASRVLFLYQAFKNLQEVSP